MRSSPLSFLLPAIISKHDGHQHLDLQSLSSTSGKRLANMQASLCIQTFKRAHQPTNDFDGRLVACIAASAHQHGQEQRHYQVISEQLLVEVQHHRGGALQHKQSQQPSPVQTVHLSDMIKCFQLRYAGSVRSMELHYFTQHCN